jgi:hypothetical protein
MIASRAESRGAIFHKDRVINDRSYRICTIRTEKGNFHAVLTQFVP